MKHHHKRRTYCKTIDCITGFELLDQERHFPSRLKEHHDLFTIGSLQKSYVKKSSLRRMRAHEVLSPTLPEDLLFSIIHFHIFVYQPTLWSTQKVSEAPKTECILYLSGILNFLAMSARFQKTLTYSFL